MASVLLAQLHALPLCAASIMPPKVIKKASIACKCTNTFILLQYLLNAFVSIPRGFHDIFALVSGFSTCAHVIPVTRTHTLLQHSTAQYTKAQQNTLQYSTVQYVVQRNTAPYNAIKPSSVQHGTVEYRTAQYSAI